MKACGARFSRPSRRCGCATRWRRSRALTAKLALAIRSASGVALASSVLVLAGALAANRRARIADAVILKILGATRGRLIATFLIEYALLGAATAAFGVAARNARGLRRRRRRSWASISSSTRAPALAAAARGWR